MTNIVHAAWSSFRTAGIVIMIALLPAPAVSTAQSNSEGIVYRGVAAEYYGPVSFMGTTWQLIILAVNGTAYQAHEGHA